MSVRVHLQSDQLCCTSGNNLHSLYTTKIPLLFLLTDLAHLVRCLVCGLIQAVVKVLGPNNQTNAA